jgi:hypothetical protein
MGDKKVATTSSTTTKKKKDQELNNIDMDTNVDATI